MRKQLDWENVDWTQADRAIARKLGGDARAVAKQRRQRGLPAPKSYRHRGMDWKKVDWTLFNWEIARQLGCTTQTVQLKRKKMNLARLAKIYGAKCGKH